VCVGLCPDWQDWNPANDVNNATEAMDAAEEWLDVPQVRRCFYLCQGGYVSVGVSSFVRLYVCRITQKLLDQFSQNAEARWQMGQGRDD